MTLTAAIRGSGWTSTSSCAASGSSSRTRSGVSSAASQANAASRSGWPAGIQTPMLALPPLSPERAKATSPSGTSRVSPSTGGEARAGSSRRPIGSNGAVWVGGAMSTLLPSAITTTWGTVSCGTYAARYSPNGAPFEGGAIR